MKVLDLYSGAGGAARGYANAGFDVTCVDIAPMPNNPFEFVQADAIEYLIERGHKYDLVHASPPCQRFSSMTKRWGDEVVGTWPNLIGPTREVLLTLGVPFVIENVVGARKELVDPIMLCGGAFKLGTWLDGARLGLRRHRYFESSQFLAAPLHLPHVGQAVGVYGHPGGSSARDGIKFASFEGWQEAMGIDWMTVHELAEAIPPAYTEFLGGQIREEWKL